MAVDANNLSDLNNEQLKELDGYVKDRRKPRGLPRGMNSNIKNKLRQPLDGCFLFFKKD